MAGAHPLSPRVATAIRGSASRALRAGFMAASLELPHSEVEVDSRRMKSWDHDS
ncbi:hypothetical protein ACFPRL_12750 [Pseudoclavibacter helvolus]